MKTKQLELDLFSNPNQLKIEFPEKKNIETKPKLLDSDFKEITYTDPNKPARKKFFYF